MTLLREEPHDIIRYVTAPSFHFALHACESFWPLRHTQYRQIRSSSVNIAESSGRGFIEQSFSHLRWISDKEVILLKLSPHAARRAIAFYR